jgi:hypothetical protein
MPYGSSNVDCIGRASTSKTTAQIAQEAQDRKIASEQEKSGHKDLVIGISVAAGVIGVIALSVGLWWFMRRRAQQGRGIWDNNHDYLPRAWHLPRNTDSDTQQGHITAHPSLTSKLSGKTAYSHLEDSYTDASLETVHIYRVPSQTQVWSSISVLGSNSQPPTPPAQMTARERKMLEATTRLPPAVGASSSSHSAQSPFVDESLNPDVQPDIIIQHRDGGAGIVHELPPPYASRTVLTPISSTSTYSPSQNSHSPNLPSS